MGTVNFEDLLDELYMLVLIEQERKLSDDEEKRYLEIFNLLKDNDIEIPFGVEI